MQEPKRFYRLESSENSFSYMCEVPRSLNFTFSYFQIRGNVVESNA